MLIKIEKREGKESKGKAQKVTQALYFIYSWGSHPWTDFNQISHIGRYAERNHPCKFWCENIKCCGKYQGSNFGVFHWNGWLPLQQCGATAQPVIWQTQSTDQEHESDRLTHAHNEENVTSVKELVAPLRQEDQKQTRRSTSQISKKRI